MSNTFDPEKRFNERSIEYDYDIETIIPGYGILHEDVEHLLINLLPSNSEILIAGFGTGYEAINYAINNPSWKITGFDIAKEMLNVANEKIKELNLKNRIYLVHGKANQIENKLFDAATSLLVMHFIPKNEKEKYLNEISMRLKTGAKFIFADITGDPNSLGFQTFLNAWKSFQYRNRKNKEGIEETFKHVNENLHIISYDDTVSLLKESGFEDVQLFFKSLVFCGFTATKK